MCITEGETRARREKRNEKRKHYEITNHEYVLCSSNDGSCDYDRRSIERTRSGRWRAGMTVTATGPSDRRMPELSQRDIAVTQGKERLKVTEWVPAKGDRAGLDLFILIDDASNPTLGMHFDDLKTFINAQPSTTAIGVGYMRNATVQIVQNFTTDHAAAAKALRLPLASVGAYGSPYLSVIDLMKRWPAGENRREVLMVTDGIDRARRGMPGRGLVHQSGRRFGKRCRHADRHYHPYDLCARCRPFSPQLLESDEWTDGHCEAVRCNRWRVLFSGTAQPVSFAPYLDQLQNILNNQYLLSFSAQPGKKRSSRVCRSTPKLPGWNSPLQMVSGCRLRSNKGHFTVKGPRIQRGPRQSTPVLTTNDFSSSSMRLRSW